VNNNGYVFTFIIAYRHKLDRLQNLRRVIDWILGFNGVELIIVEQDKSPKLPAYTLKGFKYIFTKSDLPFNKSWAFNVGTKQSTTNAIVFGDSDLLMDPQDFINSVKLLEQYESVNPYNRVIDLNPDENAQPIDLLKKITRPGRGETDIQKVPIAGGIIMFRRDSLFKVGGWSEDYIGWGGEDDYQSFKIKQLLTHIELPNRCYHLYHEKVKPDMMFYQRNLQLLNKLVTYTPQDTIKYIQNSLPKNGLKNKYADK
jgi:predicted glycosyltransferase involved in capsule biosynthesis